MTIKEYYNNYKINKKYPIELKVEHDITINDFYDNCISRNILPEKAVLEWHEMLMKYADRPDAILWVRYYESGSKKSGRWNNRRGCVTRFSDGFSYAFVSNYDVHEIFNMIRLGVKPDIDEFAELMKTFQFPLHYDSGKSCEESDINAYPCIGSTRAGILTPNHWYLAHINDLKSGFVRSDGSYKAIKINNNEGLRIYPRGVLSDWTLDKTSGHKIRTINYSLTNEEKNLVKAHFLRFTDPLNYYVTPGPKYENNAVCYRIGEYDVLNAYMSSKYETLYGSSIMKAFKKKALIKSFTNNINGYEIINISYGSLSSNNKKAKKASSKFSNKKNGVGQYAKNVFTNLLLNNKLTQNQISNLMNKQYCSKTFGISYAIYVDQDDNNVDKQRYYKQIIKGHYLITSQWYNRNKQRIDDWLKANNL